MRSPLFILLTAFIVSLLIAQQFGSLHQDKNSDAVGVTQFFLTQRPALGPAIAATDRNDHAPLLAWLNSAEPSDRLKLVGVLLALVAHDEGLALDSKKIPADATLYKHHQRFIAFTNISTGDGPTDAMLDNLIAYIGVAGTQNPTPEDQALALKLLPRLEKQLTLTPEHGTYDTVGCVYFVHGNYAKAKAAFSEAVKLGERDATSGSEEQQALTKRGLILYRKRLAAATAADLQAIEQRTPPLPPIRLPLLLPLEEGHGAAHVLAPEHNPVTPPPAAPSDLEKL